MLPRVLTGCVLFLACVMCLLGLAAAAITSETIVREIEIRGNRRTQESTIRFYLKTEIGKPYVPQILTEDIRRLYGLRAFDNIQATAEELPNGLRLILTVSEKPAVRTVTFTGNRFVDKDEISKRLLLKERSTFDRNALNDTVSNIQKHYREEGYYFAHVSPEIITVADNQVDISLSITEGKKIRINRIRFTGNKYFSR